MSKYKKLLQQLFLFGVVGGVSFLIDLLVTTSLYNYLHFPAYLAGVIGFLSAFFFNFPINRKHVFNHTEDDKYTLKTQIILYITLCVFNLGMTALLMHLLVDTNFITIGVAKFFVTGLIAVWNFLVFKLWIFSKKPLNNPGT